MHATADQDLARRAAEGDRAAFAVLAERHYERIYALAWRWTGERGAAEDVAQEATVKMAQGLRAFRGDCAFSTWAFRIAYSVAMDFLRARKKIVAFAPQDMDALCEGAEPATPETDQTNDELWRVVRALPEQQRDAILLVYGQDLSHAEAAEMMGCTEKTVSWHVHEARKKLKVQLSAAGWP